MRLHDTIRLTPISPPPVKGADLPRPVVVARIANGQALAAGEHHLDRAALGGIWVRQSVVKTGGVSDNARLSGKPDRENTMLAIVVSALAMQIAASSLPIGVAARSPDGGICVAMQSPGLRSGARVTLIQGDAPQSVLAVTIDRPVTSCEKLERALIPGPYYLARHTSSAARSSATLWVAIAGAVGTRSLGSGVLGVQLSPTYSNAQVRSCRSHEGLHLTVWAGSPLTSQRLWHEYYYLGYDVEPSCEDRDVNGTRPADRPDSSSRYRLSTTTSPPLITILAFSRFQ